MKRRSRFLYHVSTQRRESLLVNRKTPLHADPKEPPVPRLCVCPAVPNCFAARLFPANKDLHVYRTDQPRKGITPRGVWDDWITEERWLIPPMRLNWFASVPAEEAALIQDPSRIFHLSTGTKCDYLVRVAQLYQAWLVLGDRFPSRRFQRRAKRIAALCDIGDPVCYLDERLAALKGTR